VRLSSSRTLVSSAGLERLGIFGSLRRFRCDSFQAPVWKSFRDEERGKRVPPVLGLELPFEQNETRPEGFDVLEPLGVSRRRSLRETTLTTNSDVSLSYRVSTSNSSVSRVQNHTIAGLVFNDLGGLLRQPYTSSWPQTCGQRNNGQQQCRLTRRLPPPQGDQVRAKCEGRKSTNGVDLRSSAVCERGDIRRRSTHPTRWTTDW
jgi:hypothetical protein